MEDCVPLKIDLTVDPSEENSSEIDFGMVDTTVTEDVLERSVVTINSVWELEA